MKELTKDKKALIDSLVTVVTGVPKEQLTALGADSWEAIGQFYTELFRDSRIPWSHLGVRPFMPEYDPQASTDDFIIN